MKILYNNISGCYKICKIKVKSSPKVKNGKSTDDNLLGGTEPPINNGSIDGYYTDDTFSTYGNDGTMS